MASLNVPYSFTNGTTADATEVNANFTAVKSYVESSLVQADGSVQATSTAIASGAVTTAKIADGNVSTAKIADSAVTTAKVADGAITSAKIADGTIATADIANGAVTMVKTGIKSGSTVITLSSGAGNIPHGMGTTPSTAIVTNGDNTALGAPINIVGIDATNISVQALYTSHTGAARINWIAIP